MLSVSSIRYECSNCKKTFASKGYLKQHMKTSKLCKRMSEDSIARALNDTNSSSNRSITCNGCSKEFVNKKGLKSHKHFCKALSMLSDDREPQQSVHDVVSVNGNISGPVSEDGATTSDENTLPVSQTNIETNPLVCNVCKRTFKKKSGLISHIKTCTSAPTDTSERTTVDSDQDTANGSCQNNRSNSD